MVFNLLEDEIRIYSPDEESYRRYSGAVISGPYSSCLISDAREETSIMEVHFKPGGAFPFFGKTDQFFNSHVDLDSWGTKGRFLREQLIEAKTAQKRFQILEEFLFVCISNFKGRHYAVSYALKAFEGNDPKLKIKDIAKGIGLSERRFISLFNSEIGMNPKMFARIQRFQTAMTLINNQIVDGFADLAAHVGYFDQSHLIRDFLQFSNLSPSAYSINRTRLLNQNSYLKKYHLPYDE